jgi:hypothetical protein
MISTASFSNCLQSTNQTSTLLRFRCRQRTGSVVDHLVDDSRSLGGPLLGCHQPIADDVLAHDMLDVLHIAPALGISVLQPNKRRANIRRAMLGVVNNNWLLRTSRHEDLDRVVTVAVGTLAERALNAGANFSLYLRSRDRRQGNVDFLELVSLLGRQPGLRKTVDNPLDIVLPLER